MALLPSFPSTGSSDWHGARARLMALRSGPGSTPDPDDPRAGPTVLDVPGLGVPDDQEPPDSVPDGGPHRIRADDEDDLPATSRGGRLVRWWVPGPLRNARWEPGRPGALILSLIAALAAVVAAVGVWRERPVPEPAPTLPLVTAAAATAPSPHGAADEVVVSVVGRVARPGLVRLPDGTRVADALSAVGGALPGTDLIGLNIARLLSDGEQLLVGVVPPPGQPADGGSSSTSAVTSRTVDLNTATLEQLDVLPGVGPATAQRILDWRAGHGRFTSVNQLREVSGIGEARFAQLKGRVRV